MIQSRPFKGLLSQYHGTNEGTIPPSGLIEEVWLGKGLPPRVRERFWREGYGRFLVCGDNVLKSFY
jgi:hypothetical protein